MRSVGVAIMLVLAGCSSLPTGEDGLIPINPIATDPGGVGPARPVDPIEDPAGIWITCSGLRLTPLEDGSFPSAPLTADEIEAFDSAVAAVGIEGEFLADYSWTVAARRGAELELFGTPFDSAQTGGTFGQANLNVEQERLTGWGQCRLEVEAPGHGPAAVVFDPAIEPDPTSSTLHLWILERECASGLPPEGRAIVPLVIETEETITITVLVERVAGDAACPMNPWFAITVDLDAPLGERQVLDGGEIPNLALTWPPTHDFLAP